MDRELLLDLSKLFLVEALAADGRKRYEEGDRLWDISDELHERVVQQDLEEARAAE